MKISGLEKMSLVDYDGLVAATVFTAGCNFKCGFCHNSPLVLSYENLPTIPEDDILSYLSKRKGVLDGLCISGGEPTLQKDLPLFCEKVKTLGYKIKLDTNGTNPDVIKSLNENGLCDYFSMDIKNDIQGYGAVIGFDKFDTVKIEKSVDYFLSGKADYEFRTTLIKEHHEKENIVRIGEWIEGANKYFLQKFKDSDSCISSGLNEVSTDTAAEFKDILSSYIERVYLRGY